MSDSFVRLRMFTTEYEKNITDRMSTIIDSGNTDSVEPSFTNTEICEDSESSSITSMVRMKSPSTPSGQEKSLTSPSYVGMLFTRQTYLRLSASF